MGDMHVLVRTEVLKLRTVRSPWLLLLACPVLVAAGVSGLVLSGGRPLDATRQSDALAHVGLASVFTLVFGTLAVGGEYRHRTMTDTWLGTPARGRVVGAKLVVYPAFAAAAGVVSGVVGLAVTASWWAGKGTSFSWDDSRMWETLGGGIVWNTAFAAIGVGVGALVRSLVGAIAVALAWVALVEGIVGQLVGGFARWLPFTAGRAVGAGAKDLAGGDLLPRWGGAAVLVAYALAFSVLAVTTSMRRDVP